ncbi:hypothetical protein DIPPA_05990 [Diplonema papillatum]|nr:hypothetical protein DIPPA_05990 [Diplonema papillatum]
MRQLPPRVFAAAGFAAAFILLSLHPSRGAKDADAGAPGGAQGKSDALSRATTGTPPPVNPGPIPPSSNTDPALLPTLTPSVPQDLSAPAPLANQIFAGVVAFFVTSLAAVAGIGGGGILVPVYILAARYSPDKAVPMSQATIFGCAGLNLLYMLSRKHPVRGPLIDWNAIMILLPMTLSGTLVGHMLGQVLPQWLRLVLLVVLLGYMLRRTLDKAKRTKAELERKRVASESAPLLPRKPPLAPEVENAALEGILTRRFRQVPPEKLLYCAAVWAILVAMSWYRAQYVTCGSFGYWATTVAVVAGMAAVTFAAGTYLQQADKAVIEAGYTMRGDEFLWDAKNVVYYPVLSIAAGVGASLLGIGGGMILGILLFEMSHKILPEVSAATATVATALVASKACAEFYMYDELPLAEAGFYFVIGSLGTVLGRGPISSYITANGKSHYIIYALAAIILGSLVALFAAGVVTVWKTYTAGDSMGLRPLCPP